MKKKNIFSRIIIWSFLLSPMFVSCTQDEFFDESCMYSTNASRFSGAGIEMTTTSSARASNTNSTTGMGEISISDGGVGNYSVEIVTEYGECFTGNFRL